MWRHGGFVDDPIPELEEGSDEEVVELDPTLVEGPGLTGPEWNWQADYTESPTWQDQWRATQDPAAARPVGIRLHMQQMILEGRICIPETQSRKLFDYTTVPLGMWESGD
jgi:hypothetical protein